MSCRHFTHVSDGAAVIRMPCCALVSATGRYCPCMWYLAGRTPSDVECPVAQREVLVDALKQIEATPAASYFDAGTLSMAFDGVTKFARGVLKVVEAKP